MSLSTAGELQELVADAARAATPLRVAGRSSWMNAGRPVDATRIATTATLDGVVDYVPGDLTITVRSGTTMRQIETLTRNEGQWLPLDPFGSAGGTIGATIATGSFGPLACGFGRTRDLVLGMEFVSGEGRIVRGGGRVVKNVAGFDLVRLMTGSWGTLGVITEATLRLYALPEESVTLSLGVPDGVSALSKRIYSTMAAPGTPFALELVNATVAERIGLSAETQILARIGGNSRAVAAHSASLTALGGVRIISSEAWSRLSEIEDDDGASQIVMRLSALPSALAQLWIDSRDATSEIADAMLHATPSLGIVRCVLPSSASVETVQALARAAPSVVFERLPAGMWSALSPTIVPDRLSQGIKRAFDPANILNPGIMGALL